MTIKDITTEEEFNAAIGSDKPVLVDFYATWCKPCHELAPHLEAISDEFKEKLDAVKVNGVKLVGLKNKYGVNAYPTIMLFKNGKKLTFVSKNEFDRVEEADETSVRQFVAQNTESESDNTTKTPVKDISRKEEFTAAIGSNKPVLVDFYATWCKPCKKMATIVDAISDEFKEKLDIVKVNADEFEDLTFEYKVRFLPTIMLFKGGKQLTFVTQETLDRVKGNDPSSVRELIAQNTESETDKTDL